MPRNGFTWYLHHTWADDVCTELRTNSQGFLHTRQLQLANQLPAFLLNLSHDTVEKYASLLTARGPYQHQAGPGKPQMSQASLSSAFLIWAGRKSLNLSLCFGKMFGRAYSIKCYFLWVILRYRMSLIHCFECKPSVSFTSLTSVLRDGRDLAITVTDVRQKPRQTARSCKGYCGRAGRGAECGTSRGSKED